VRLIVCKTEWLPQATGMTRHQQPELWPSLCLKRSLFQKEDPHIIYEVGIASMPV
jgi:hypothetical protein